MSDWKIIIPASTTNKVLNPSGEIAGNFAAEAGTTVTRVTTYQHYGLYSYRVETSANNEGVELTLSTLTNAIHYVTVRVRGTLPAAWDWSLDDATFTAPTLLEAIDSNWSLYGLQFPAAQANASTKLSIHQNGAGSGDFYLDGIQVEANTTWTTYCDGTQPGCAWNGITHASTSTRSAYSRAGGQVYDLETDYYLNVGGMSGTGTPPQGLGIDKYAALPGGELNSLKVDSRVFTLTGVISGTSQSNFHTRKQTLLNALSPDAYPEDENGVQPVRLRYHGATVHKEIAAHYDSGLEGELSASDPCAWEKVAVRFLADDPYWYEYGESAALLDTNDSATFTTNAARLKSTGQWSNLGPPNAAGTYNNIRCMVEDETYVYIGGSFLNFDNIAAADNIVRYNKQTGAYSALDVGLSAAVLALALAPDGDLYIGGSFTNAGGVAAADYLCRWDHTNFNAVGTPVSGAAAITNVQSLAFDQLGRLYIGGDFANWANVAAADNVVMWDGINYTALSSGANGIVYTVILGLNNIIYLGGAFTTPGTYAASWNGTAFTDLTGINDDVLVMALDPATGIIYASGTFTVPTGYIAAWNGVSWSTLGSGLNKEANSLAVGADGILYAGGEFTSAGGFTIADRSARWNRYAWAHLDLDLPGTPVVYTILASKNTDPVIKQNYDLYLGFNTNGTGYMAGIVTVTNEGNVPTFPKIIFERSGGTTATIETLKNESTGKELLFNYSLLDGERLTIDLAPTKQSVVSSFFGDRPDAILANCDFGSWQLLGGSNNITSFIATSGAPTVTAYLLFKEQYKSQD